MAREEFVFAPLAREEIKFKGLLVAPTGAGKTVSAMLMAYGLCGEWGRIAVVDTEHQRAKQIGGQVYGGVRIPQRGDPGGVPLHSTFGPPYSPERFVALMEQVRQGDVCDVLIVDGLTPFWSKSGGVLEIVDKSGGWASAGKTVTPRFNALVDAICNAPVHVIMTLRAKMKYVIEGAVDEATGKQRVTGMKRVGMEGIFRPDTIEYEATTCWHLDGDDHRATADKDNTNIFDGALSAVITPETGKLIRQWCDGAVSRVGSPEWCDLKQKELAGYAGTLDGLVQMWVPIFEAKGKIETEAFAKLVAAKNASKTRLESAK